MTTLFGTAGNPDAFYDAGYKASADMPAWLSAIGLTAYEYQCSRGVHVGQATAEQIGLNAREFGIKLSIHAPYFINLASEDERIIANTQKHFIRSLEVAKWMGADRVVFHIGGSGKTARAAAMERAKKALAVILDQVEQRGLSRINLLPETMGKQNQLGTLDEVLSLCKLSRSVLPAVDFGHLHAVTQGKYLSSQEFATVFEIVGETLGQEAAQELHIHFSKIEFTKAGEKRHWTFDDPFGPSPECLLSVIAQKGYTPRIICESAGTQAKDAKTMRQLYAEFLEKVK